jgi:hypothetical protein
MQLRKVSRHLLQHFVIKEGCVFNRRNVEALHEQKQIAPHLEGKL